jgi:hypothetical protein
MKRNINKIILTHSKLKEKVRALIKIILKKINNNHKKIKQIIIRIINF